MATAAEKAAAAAAAKRNNAVNAIKRALPQLANPEKYVTSANNADLAGARKEYLQTNLGLNPALFKSGNSYDLTKANKAYAVKSLGLDYTKFAKNGYDINQANQAARFKELGVKDVESLIDSKGKFNVAGGEEKLIKDVYKLDPANFAYSGTVVTGQRANPVTGKLENITQEVLKYDTAKAGQRFEEARPKIETASQYPANFTQAVNNYSKAFEAAISVWTNPQLIKVTTNSATRTSADGTQVQTTFTANYGGSGLSRAYIVQQQLDFGTISGYPDGNDPLGIKILRFQRRGGDASDTSNDSINCTGVYVYEN